MAVCWENMASLTPLKAQWITDGDSESVNEWLLQEAYKHVAYHNEQMNAHRAQMQYWEKVIQTLKETPKPAPKPVVEPTPAPVVAVAPIAPKPTIPAAAATVTAPVATKSAIEVGSSPSVAARASIFAAASDAPSSSISVKDRMAMFQKSTSAAPVPVPVRAASSSSTSHHATATPAAVIAPAATHAAVVQAAPVQAAPAAIQPPIATAATSEPKLYCKALYAYAGNADNKVYEMAENEIFEVESTTGDWWLVRKLDAPEGSNAFVPRNYVELCSAPAQLAAARTSIPSAAATHAPVATVASSHVAAAPAPAPIAQPEPEPEAEPYVTAQAIYDYSNNGDATFLSFQTGSILRITGNLEGESWWLAEDAQGNKGYVPSNYMKLI